MKLPRHISLLGDAATKKVMKQFCTKYDLVYFGRVDARDDEHQLVRGVTVSTTHIDDNYAVGTFQSHDLIYVQRKNTLTFPGKPSADYKSMILQVDLAHGGMPHVFIDAKRHDDTFYANLSVKVPHFQVLTQSLPQLDEGFIKKFRVFGAPHQHVAIGSLLSSELTATLAQQFSQFDYEIQDDHVYVYSNAHVVTLSQLQDMLRVGVWLADVCNLTKIPG